MLPRTEFFAIAKDYDRFPEFVKLVKLIDIRQGKAEFKVPAVVIATFLFCRMFAQLSYNAKLQPLGYLTEWDFELLAEDVAIPIKDFELLMTRSKLLTKDDKGFFCMIFAICNESLSRDHIAPYLKSHDSRYMNKLKQRFTRDAEKIVATFPEEHHQAVDGKPVTAEEMNSMTVVVRTIDAMFGREMRMTDDYGIGLIQDTIRIVRMYRPLELDTILKRLLVKRHERNVPRKTERIVSKWRDIIIFIQPEAGFGFWSMIMAKDKDYEGNQVATAETPPLPFIFDEQ